MHHVRVKEKTYKDLWLISKILWSMAAVKSNMQKRVALSDQKVPEVLGCLPDEGTERLR